MKNGTVSVIAFESCTSVPPTDWVKADTNVVSALGQYFWLFGQIVKPPIGSFIDAKDGGMRCIDLVVSANN